MPHIMEVDTDVFEKIQAEAEPLVDTPSSVLRRLLGLDQKGGAGPAGGQRSKSSRAPLGSLLPESEYELPLLQALAERGGSAPTRVVIDAVGERLADRLTDLDRAQLKSGGPRWENRVQFTRLTLKDRGLLKADSSRGVWELSDAGREAQEDKDREAAAEKAGAHA